MLHIGIWSQSFKQFLPKTDEYTNHLWALFNYRFWLNRLDKMGDPSFLTGSQGMEMLLVHKPCPAPTTQQRRGEVTPGRRQIQNPGFCVRAPTWQKERICPFSCKWLRLVSFFLKNYLQATDWLCILIFIISCAFISLLVGIIRKGIRDNELLSI